MLIKMGRFPKMKWHNLFLNSWSLQKMKESMNKCKISSINTMLTDLVILKKEKLSDWLTMYLHLEDKEKHQSPCSMECSSSMMSTVMAFFPEEK
jgi:hypothetical protein